MRCAISAAPALVKVSARIASGATPFSNSRNTRAASTCVLPVPADADSQTCASGELAAAWLPCSGGNAPAGRPSATAVPFVAAHQLVVFGIRRELRMELGGERLGAGQPVADRRRNVALGHGDEVLRFDRIALAIGR